MTTEAVKKEAKVFSGGNPGRFLELGIRELICNGH